MEIYNILKLAIDQGATDIHLVEGLVPIFRIKKVLTRLDNMPICTNANIKLMIDTLFSGKEEEYGILKKDKKVDIGLKYNGYKFRINISKSKGSYTLAIRVISNEPIDLDKYGMRNIVNRMREFKSGIILVTGKVNSGKTTTLNAYIQEVNKNVNCKIITLEDPIEYEHTSDKSIILQKEVGEYADVKNFYDGLINILREDSDIIVVGEIRDKKTMDVAIELAESGQLVIGTLHTKSCAETIDRIIGMYAPEEQSSIKFVLSTTLKMIASQKLLPGLNEKVALITELMIVDNVISALIRKDKFVISEIQDAIHTGESKGCISLEKAFAEEYQKGNISLATIRESVDKDKFEKIKEIIVRNQNN